MNNQNDLPKKYSGHLTPTYIDLEKHFFFAIQIRNDSQPTAELAPKVTFRVKSAKILDRARCSLPLRVSYTICGPPVRDQNGRTRGDTILVICAKLMDSGDIPRRDWVIGSGYYCLLDVSIDVLLNGRDWTEATWSSDERHGLRLLSAEGPGKEEDLDPIKFDEDFISQGLSDLDINEKAFASTLNNHSLCNLCFEIARVTIVDSKHHRPIPNQPPAQWCWTMTVTPITDPSSLHANLAICVKTCASREQQILRSGQEHNVGGRNWKMKIAYSVTYSDGHVLCAGEHLSGDFTCDSNQSERELEVCADDEIQILNTIGIDGGYREELLSQLNEPVKNGQFVKLDDRLVAHNETIGAAKALYGMQFTSP
ncbi:hypothetical protein F5Y16DRAFT_396895 [Xylariaceae sp. FL0255]|nr:hypothetical protein F5Y16DRAFT_396895 [Xylariaceae sp. FL0255]